MITLSTEYLADTSVRYGLVTSAIENEEFARYLSQLLENFEPNIRRVIPLLYDQGRYHGFSSFP
jgi:hypothetical protein